MDIRKHGDYVIYQNTISMVYLKAAKDVLPDVTIEIDNSLNKGFYTLPSEPVSKQQVDAISARMKELIEADLPIIKEDGIYRLEDHCDYFYGGIAPSTGCAKLFELRKYAEGILLRFPYPTDPDMLPEYHDDKNLHIAFSEAKKWQQLLGINYMPDLNEKIAGGKAKDLILLSEALHEKKIAEIADMITEGKKRIILIAGPSSSGKTTTAKRLSVQLRVNGLDPLYMGTDDYFVERSE
ncbi:MAG: nucleoside kinase, partial [Firmicutes bacterium]|nr:nucleoside kinase [Bacillota bacterium]